VPLLLLGGSAVPRNHHPPIARAADSSQLESLGLRSTSQPLGLNTDATKEERVLGDEAVGDVDNGEDHVPNIVGGLKA
jgi:hypothetical protein